jgi:hypothetical protein
MDPVAVKKMAGKPKKPKHVNIGVPNPEAVKAALAQLGEVAKAAGLVMTTEENGPVGAETPEFAHTQEFENSGLPTTEGAAQSFVTVTQKTGAGEQELKAEDAILRIMKFVTTPAVVNLEMGVTLNLGQFESARITVGVSVPCYKEEVDQAYAYAKTWITERLQAEVKEVRENDAQKKKMY